MTEQPQGQPDPWQQGPSPSTPPAAPSYGTPSQPGYGTQPGYGGQPGPTGQPGYGPAPTYGAPYAYGQATYDAYGARTHPNGTTILVLGLLGVTVLGLLAPVAWYMGNKALAEIDAAPGTWSNRGNVVAGRVLGIIGTVLLALGLLFLVVFVVFGLAAVSGISQTG